MTYSFLKPYADVAEKFPETDFSANLESPVMVIPNALSRETTRRTYFNVMQSISNGHRGVRGTVYGADGVTPTLAESYRRVDIFPKELVLNSIDTLKTVEDMVNYESAMEWGTGVLAPCTEWWLGGYGVGDRFSEHSDGLIKTPKGYKRVADRVVSAILYFNTKDSQTTGFGFTGGSLVFPGIVDEAGTPLTIEPREGDLILFPSSWRYCHMVTEVTSGYRLALTNFFRFKNGSGS